MARYNIVELDGRRFIPIRYDNFAALGARVEPAVPWSLVPFYDDVADVLAEASHLEAELTGKLAAMGVEKLVVALGEAVNPPAYAAKLGFPFRVFRGERSLRFNIMPTRFRFSGQPDPTELTRRRTEFEMRCAERMRAYLQSHGAPQATLEQARAAARHHGCPSSFVDFTFNAETAAFFAHPAFTTSEREKGADAGILYSLGIEDFEQLFGGLAAWSLPGVGERDILYMNLAPVWQIPYRSFDPTSGAIEDAMLRVEVPERFVVKPITIRTRIVPVIQRIAAQQGIFIDGCIEGAEDWWSQVLLWSVLDFASRKWCFRRQDFAYENAATGVTAAKLYPPLEPELAELTRDFERCS